MTDNNWPDPARPGVPMNPERDGWHWVQRVDKGFVPSPRIVLWTDDWASGQFSWDAVGYEADEQKLGRDFRYLGPCLTPAEVDARVAQARRDALEEAARWHDEQAVWMTKGRRLAKAEEHRKHAAAIRALKGEGND
jgi:hypothetical protein